MNLNELYARVDLEQIEAWVAEGKEENLTLDFKLVNSPTMNRDDRRNYAKALSGFANSNGGLIIWGIDARKVGEVDCAAGLRPIANVDALLSALNSQEGESARPLIAGVKHKTLKTSESSGYAVTLVPESDIGPHRAEQSEKRYYKRSGDSFYIMEHFDIADMFGRRRQSNLSLHLDLLKAGTTTDNMERPIVQVQLRVSLENLGRGSAHAPYFEIEPTGFSRSYGGIDGNGAFGLPVLSKSRTSIKYGGSSMHVIHPGEQRAIDVFETNVHSEFPVPDREIKYKVASDGCPMVEKSATVLGSNLMAFLSKP